MLYRTLDRLTAVVNLAVVLIGIVLTSALTLEVVARFIFDFSVFFINGLARLLLIWFFFLGAGLALRAGNHIGLHLLIQVLPPRGRLLVTLLAQGLVCLFLIALMISSLELLGSSWAMVEPTLGISVFWQYLALPVGTALMCVYQLEAIVRTLSDSDGVIEGRTCR